jgi:uncharacterized protein YbbC (DUF1343 family)
MKTKSVVLILFLFLSCQKAMVRQADNLKPVAEPAKKQKIILGVDNFLQHHLDLVAGKRVGLLTNPSGVNGDILATSDLLFDNNQINLTAYYGPEHGIRGDYFAGSRVSDTTDAKTGLPVFSLYGERRKPTPGTLDPVDVIMVDIQDIGLRGYTYIYTMAMVMEAAAENGKSVIVLDRPDPVGGLKVEGNLVEPEFYSFVGLYPIPYRPGMTIGELAKLFNNEYGINCDLTVVPMLGWKRDMYWEDTGLSWVPTSPHVPHAETILPMIATGTFGELGTLSEGVGYTSPFELAGAPWVKADEFADALNRLHLPGIYFRPMYFKPYYFHYQGQDCQGVQLHVTDRDTFSPYVTGLYIMRTHMDLYPDHDLFANQDRIGMFNRVMGTDKIMNMLQEGVPVEEIERSWQADLQKFLDIRIKYLIYD